MHRVRHDWSDLVHRDICTHPYHDTEDIQSICKRCVIINHGKIIIDTTTKELISSYIKNKNIVITPETIFKTFPVLPEGIDYVEKTKDQIIVKVNTEIIGTQKSLQELTKNFEDRLIKYSDYNFVEKKNLN